MSNSLKVLVNKLHARAFNKHHVR